MKNRFFILIAADFAFGMTSLLLAQSGSLLTNANAHQPVLVELFTSEGCSSCPPADQLLQELDGQRTKSGKLIVGISEHVTYWNRLGWTDPFSSEIYTQRQNGYAERFHLGDVYTPQMVINGREQIVGSIRPALLEAINRKTQDRPVVIKVASVKRDGDALTVAFNVEADREGGPFDVFLVLTDDKDHSQVLRGENAARTLEHVSVARSFQRVASMSASGPRTVKVDLPDIPSHGSKVPQHLILFAQSPELGDILGATSQQL